MYTISFSPGILFFKENASVGNNRLYTKNSRGHECIRVSRLTNADERAKKKSFNNECHSILLRAPCKNVCWCVFNLLSFTATHSPGDGWKCWTVCIGKWKMFFYHFFPSFHSSYSYVLFDMINYRVGWINELKPFVIQCVHHTRC